MLKIHPTLKYNLIPLLKKSSSFKLSLTNLNPKKNNSLPTNNSTFSKLINSTSKSLNSNKPYYKKIPKSTTSPQSNSHLPLSNPKSPTKTHSKSSKPSKKSKIYSKNDPNSTPSNPPSSKSTKSTSSNPSSLKNKTIKPNKNFSPLGPTSVSSPKSSRTSRPKLWNWKGKTTKKRPSSSHCWDPVKTVWGKSANRMRALTQVGTVPFRWYEKWFFVNVNFSLSVY